MFGFWSCLVHTAESEQLATLPDDIWEVILDFVHDLALASTIWPKNIEITFLELPLSLLRIH